MSDRLTTQQVLFAKVYAETNDAILAYQTAYPESTKTVKHLDQAAYNKLTDPKIKSFIENKFLSFFEFYIF